MMYGLIPDDETLSFGIGVLVNRVRPGMEQH